MNLVKRWHIRNPHRVALCPQFPGRIGIWKCWLSCGGKKTGEPSEKPTEQAGTRTNKNFVHIIRYDS